MCLTALKNSLVLGNCQPIISTPSSGLSLAHHCSFYHSFSFSLVVCTSLQLSLSIYLIFSLNSPSKHSFSVTYATSHFHCYIPILPVPYPHTILKVNVFFPAFTKAFIEGSTSLLFFHGVFTLPFLLCSSIL